VGCLLQIAHAQYVCRTVLPSFILYFFLLDHQSNRVSGRLLVATSALAGLVEVLIKDDVAVVLSHKRFQAEVLGHKANQLRRWTIVSKLGRALLFILQHGIE